MHKMALLTYNQQQAIKPISANNEKKYSPLEWEVENSTLAKLIGLPLLQNIQDNPTSAENILILDGDSYVCGNYTLRHKGLRYVLAYLIFARYVGESMINDTFTGMVQKTRPDSEILSNGALRRQQQVFEEIAMQEFQNIKNYLIEKGNPYFCKSTNPFPPRMTTIRRTAK